MASADHYDEAVFRRVTGVSEAEIDEVLTLVRGSDLLELEVAWGKTRLSLRRQPAAEPSNVDAASEDASTSDHPEERRAITSPVVGLFHPAVQVGDEVKHTQSLGTIEAIGMATTIEAPYAGVVEELVVGEGEPAEYGQVLVVLRKP